MKGITRGNWKSSKPDYNRLKKADEDAKARGCVVIKPKPKELFIDIDREADLVWFLKSIDRVANWLPCTWEVKDSPSGVAGRHHVYVTFERDLSVWERVALQAVLGSDRTRELLSVLRILSGDPNPTLFFEKEEKK